MSSPRAPSNFSSRAAQAPATTSATLRTSAECLSAIFTCAEARGSFARVMASPIGKGVAPVASLKFSCANKEMNRPPTPITGSTERFRYGTSALKRPAARVKEPREVNLQRKLAENKRVESRSGNVRIHAGLGFASHQQRQAQHRNERQIVTNHAAPETLVIRNQQDR